MHRAVFLLLLLGLPALAPAQSPIEEARELVASYHSDLSGLDRGRDLLEKLLKTDRQVEAMILLSRIYFIWGDVRASSREEKLEAYERGREIAKRAVELAPKNADAHVWYATNTGRFGQTKGVLRSLFLLPTIKNELEVIFDLNPKHLGAHVLAGNVELAIPWGDLDKAEEYFRKGLKLDPHFTVLRVDLARLLIRRGKYDEARKELRRVLNEKAPTNLADWTIKDAKRARELLESIKDKSKDKS
ncbi:MAG: tetratricopeptide repeat protein [Candidatus Rokubacteria bacterium]|nr:tetratricopeptide repeat protein [Candidatus Rokubacteria bacterium]